MHVKSSLELQDRLVQLHAEMCSAQREALEIVAELERRDAYGVDGARNMPDWLGYLLGLEERTARDWCRTATSLEGLPAIASAFEDGDISWDKVRWLSTFCTPDEDAEWASEGVGATPAQVRRYALYRKRMSREAVERRQQIRYLRMVRDEENGVMRIWGVLADADGLAVKAAIDRAADQVPKDPDTGNLVPYAQRCADALGVVCQAALSADPDIDRATVVCHVEASMLTDEDGVATIDGMTVAAETARRLMCGGHLELVVHDENGLPVGLSSKGRFITGGIRRSVLERDGGCGWPACTADQWLIGHHIIHVVDGGTTEEENSLMLCHTHHKHVHEGGARFRGRPGVDLHVILRDGRRIDAKSQRSITKRAASVARAP